MKDCLKSELKKITSIRSTYILFGLAIILPALTNFITGFKTHSSTYNPNSYDSHAYIQALFAATVFAGTFISLIGLLNMAHEYRYRTIIYSLINTKSRSNVLFAKFIIVSILAVIMGIFVMAAGFAAFMIGVHFQHINLPPQSINWLETFARCLFFLIGYGGVGLIAGALIRNLVGAIAVLFVVPGTIEGIVGLLLKGKNQYLPFTSIKQLVIDPGQVPANMSLVQTSHPLRSAVTFSIYFVVGVLITWYLFLKRDALKD